MTKRPLALITGPTSGIGRAFAFACAGAGYDLVLVGRRATELEQLTQEVRAAHGASSTLVACDLSKSGSAQQCLTQIKEPIDLLINNAGYGVHGPFIGTDGDSEKQLVTLQIETLLDLTKAVLPAMIKKGKGRILNIGSVYSVTPVPFQAVYGACKAFMWSFSVALGQELKGTGVTVTVLCPGSTRTAFRKRSHLDVKNPDAGMSAEKVAACGLKAALAGKRLAVPGFANKLFVRAALIFPAHWTAAVLKRINDHRGVNNIE